MSSFEGHNSLALHVSPLKDKFGSEAKEGDLFVSTDESTMRMWKRGEEMCKVSYFKDLICPFYLIFQAYDKAFQPEMNNFLHVFLIKQPRALLSDKRFIFTP